MSDVINQVNSYINNIVWGTPVLTLIIGTGVLLTILTKGFQFTHFPYALKEIFGGLRKSAVSKKNAPKEAKKHSPDEPPSISQFQALCTALSATIGTGNISGIAYAITVGGPGAIFWMWIASLTGMITGFSEKVLGIYYRKRNADGEWCGGPMYYLEYGLGSKKGCKMLGHILAVFFSLFTILASFGIGNMSQVTSIRESILSLVSFSGVPKTDRFFIGAFIAAAAAFVILGGLRRIADANEKLVPFMAGFYILGATIILLQQAGQICPAFGAIFRHAFSKEAMLGGAGGTIMRHAIACGFKRGVFSNEAGLGSSVIVHAVSDVKEPVKQGFWGIFEVFFDTIIICTLTALVILTSGLVDLNTGLVLSDNSSLALATEIFTGSFGMAGGLFMALSVTLFAFATILGWHFYGVRAWEYLFGKKTAILYKYIYIAVILLGCMLQTDFVIDLSDTFNGLMAIPNMLGVLSLTPTVLAILDNYKQRNFYGATHLTPMLSYFPDIQKAQMHRKDFP
ncbi:MAG: sodium:alanine symporter family protein [Lachnospiraceae bacterium]|nr:sodium:alanine symporter family protein [Lachnospiraceae bacterium]